MNSGVYEIINVATCKKYVGSSKNVKLRLRQHYLQLKRGVHFNSHLQNSFNKYNEKAFIFRVIEYCEESKRVEREKYYIDEFHYKEEYFGYNIMDPLMTTMSEATKEKIRKSMKGVNTWTKGVKREAWVSQVLSKSLSGLKRSDESKQMYRAMQLGSKNTMAKLTEAQVLEIINIRQRDNTTYRKLALMFGVSFGAISNIFNRGWGDIPAKNNNNGKIQPK